MRLVIIVYTVVPDGLLVKCKWPLHATALRVLKIIIKDLNNHQNYSRFTYRTYVFHQKLCNIFFIWLKILKYKHSWRERQHRLVSLRAGLNVVHYQAIQRL